MFEGVVTAVLNKFLGDYVANMEQKQLNLGIFSGNVVLTDLKLKKEALDKLNLPIEVFHGHLGRLELHIPWRNLKSEPVSVLVEDLLLLAGPRAEVQFDAELEEERAQRAKQERLETAELFTTSMQNKELADDMHQESFVNSLVTKIVDNLQVTVKNIHIRFEDRTSNKERLFTVGILLKNLSAVSTDENWNETFIVNPQDAVNKLVKLDSFAVYWNTRDQSMSTLEFEEFVPKCREGIDDSTHSFIIKPVSGTGRATLNKKFKKDLPKTLLNVLFDAFGINVNYEQYYDILCALASVSTAQRALPYRKFRPSEEKLGPEDLWRFAAKCYLSEIHEKNQRRTWSYLMQRRALRKEYVNLYSNKIILGQLNELDAKLLMELERLIEFDDIMHYRSLARAFARKSQASTPKSTGSWFWGWLGYKSAASSDLVKDEDIQELYETIDYDAGQAASSDSMPPETKLLQVNFELGEGSFSLSQDPDSPNSLVALIFTKLLATFTQRPKSIAVDLSLKDLKVIENMIEASNFRELLQVKPNKSSPTTDKPFLSVFYDQLPTNPDASAEIVAEMRPLVLVVNLMIADHLTSFFLNNKTKLLLEALKAEARRTFDTIQVQTRANLQRALEEHKGTDLRVKVSAPIILLPEDPTDLEKSIFVVDLGKIKAASELVSLAEKQKIEDKRRRLTATETESFHDLLYDKIRIKLREMAVYFFENTGAWLDNAEESFESYDDKENKIIDEIDLDLVVENSIIPNAPNIARTKLSATLPEVIVFMSDFKLQKVMSLVSVLTRSGGSTESDAKGSPKLEVDKKTKSRRTPKLQTIGRPELGSEEEFYDAFDDMRVGEGGTSKGDVPEDEDIDALGLVGEFSIEKIVVFMSKTVDRVEDMAISLMAESMRLELTVFETLTKVDFHLGGIGLREHFSSDDGFLLVDAQADSESEDLLQVNLQLVKPTNAEFSTTYAEVERSLTVSLSSIKISIEPNNMFSVAEFVFQRILPALEPKESSTVVHSAEPSLTSGLVIETYQPKTTIDFEFSGLRVRLMDGAAMMGYLDAEQLVAKMSLVGKRLQLTSEITSLQLVGYHGGNQTKLVFFEGDSVASFSFENNCKGIAGIIDGSNLAKLHSGSLSVVYDASAYATLVSTSAKLLKIVELLGSSSSELADTKGQPTSQGNSLDAGQAPTATYVDLLLETPIIFLPSQDQSNVLAFYLGNLSVKNSVFPAPENQLDQVFDIVLSEAHIGLQSNEEGSPERELLQKFSIPLSIRLTADAMKRSYADVEVDGEVEAIKAELNEDDFGRMMQIVQDTTSSLSTILDSLPKARERTEVEMRSSNAIDRQEESEHFPFDAKLGLKLFCMRLKDPKDKPVVELCIEGVNVMIVSHSKRGLGLELCVESLRVSDVSDTTLKFNDLAAIGIAATGLNKPLVDAKKQLLFRMESKPDGTSIMNAYIESPRIFVLFDSIFYMKKFFLSNLPKSKGSVKNAQRVESPEAVSSTASTGATNTGPSTAETPERDFMFKLNILDASLIIPEDRSTEETAVLDLRVGSFSIKMTRELFVEIDDVSSSIYNMNAPEKTRIAVIDYFATQVSLGKEPEAEVTSLSVNVYPLTVVLSYQDLQLILSFLSTMSAAQERHQYIVQAETDSSTGGSTLPSAPSPSPEPALITEKGKISLEYVRIVVIDDSSSAVVPLMELTVDAITTELTSWSSQLRVDFGARISLNCYNPSLSYWEPIIEPWVFSIAMGKLEEEPNSDNTICLSSLKGLEVIVAHDSLERILSMLHKLGMEKRSPSASRELSPPYCFGNFLETVVAVTGNTKGSDSVTLQPQQSSPFSFESWRQQRSSLFVAEREITISFPGDEYKPIEGFTIDRDGYFPLKFASQSLETSEIRVFFAHAFLAEGIRHVYFRERIMLLNETDSTIVITLEGSDSGRSLQIEPKKRACIPPIFEVSTCAITPLVEDLKLAPVSDKFNPGESIHVNGKIFRAESITADGSSYNMLCSTEAPSLHSILNISFVAPIVVENLLPVDIQVQFTQDSYRKVSAIAEAQEMPIYSIDPTRPSAVAVSLPSLGLFSTNECEITHTHKILDLVMQNEDGLELKVSLNPSLLGNGALRLTIAAYYLLVNQTDMTLQCISEANNKVKRNGQVFTLPSAADARPLLLFSHPNPKNLKNRSRLRIADSNWSEPLSFEAVGAEFEFSVKSMLTAKWYNVGGYVTLGQGKFGLTKVIYIASRYYVVNDTGEDLIISDSHTHFTIAAKSQVPIHIDPSNIECIKINSFAGSKDEWSAPFDIRNTGKVYVREESKGRLFRVGRNIVSPSFFVTLSLTDSWPYILRNQSSIPVSFSQKNTDVWRTCEARSQLYYAWDQPSFTEKQVVLRIENKEFILDVLEIGKKSHFKVKSDTGESLYLDLEVKAQGPAVLVLLKDRFASTDALSETGDDEQSNTEYVEIFQSVILAKLPHVAVSLIGRDLKEIMLVYLRDIEARYAISKQFLSYGLTIKWMQIDNQAFDWDLPMLLYPAVLTKSRKELEEHPFLSLGAIQSRDRSYGVTYYKYLGLLVQEMALEMGEELLRNILNFVNLSVLVAEPKTIVSTKDCTVQKYEVERDSSEVLFFEFFQIHPIKVNLTFSRTEGSPDQDEVSSSSSYNPLTTVIDVLTMTFGNISEAPMKFNALVLENILSRKATLQEIVLEHYKAEALSQIHLVLGSADFLGNPVGLVSTLGSGVTDLFYEPYQGFVSDRPQDIGIGLARGGISLVRKTVSGLSGTLSKFTGSLAKGLSAATMDKSYQQRRRVDRARNKPRHALSGVSTGVQQLYSGVKSGLTGVVDKPMEGAKEGGIGGFFKGVGVGLVGVVTKPMVGLIDMTTSLTEGIKGSADDTQNTVTQVRFPRVIPADRKIRSYDVRQAFGQSILIGVIGFKEVGKELYVAHMDVAGDESIVIVTNKRLIVASYVRLKIVWEVSLLAIEEMTIEIDNLLVIIGSGEMRRTKCIPSVDTETKKWLIGIVKEQKRVLQHY